MTDPIARAVAAVFRSAVATDAVYTPAATGVPIAVRAIVRAPDAVVPGFGSEFITGTVLVDVRCGDIADPADGDTIVVAGETRLVQGTPRRDSRRHVWTLDTRPDDGGEA